MVTDTDKKNLLSLLKRKQELMQAMLDSTKLVENVEPEIDYANRFIDMQERRASIVENMKSLDRKINLPLYKPLWDGLDKEFLKQLTSIETAIKKTAAQILSINDEIDKKMSKILVEVKKEIKTLNSAKNVNNYYQNETLDSQDSSSFNMSN